MYTGVEEVLQPWEADMAVAKKQGEIFRAALSLPEEVRIALAEQLLESLDSANQREIDARWAREAEDRIDAYDRGEIAAFPIDEVFSSLRAGRYRSLSTIGFGGQV